MAETDPCKDPRNEIRWGGLYGYDSLGEKIITGIPFLARVMGGGIVFFQNLRSFGFLRDVSSGVALVSHKRIDEVFEEWVGVEIVEEVVVKGDKEEKVVFEPWKSLKVSVEMVAQEATIRFTIKTESFSDIGTGAYWNDIKKTVPIGGTAFISPPTYEDPTVYALVLEEGVNTRVVFFRFRETGGMPLERVKLENWKAINTDQDVVDRLCAEPEFEWFSISDLKNSDGSFNHQILSIVQTIIRDSGLSLADRKRREKIYAYGRVTGAIDTSEMSAEQMYLAAREWARVVSLGVQGFGRAIPASADERRNFYVEVENAIDREIGKLLTNRREWEKSHFGRSLPDKDVDRQTRHVSRTTMDYVFILGQCFSRGEIAVVVTDALSRSDGRSVFVVLAEIIAHEWAHYGHNSWLWEEVFAEWYSVLFPRSLNKEKFVRSTLYNLNPYTMQEGGAIKLHQIIEEAKNEAIRKGRNPDEVVESAIATFKLRQLRARGLNRFLTRRVKFEGKRVMLFGDLYEQLTHKRFEDEMNGCTDDDYDLVKKKYEEVTSVGKSNLIPEYRMLGRAAYEKVMGMVKAARLQGR